MARPIKTFSWKEVHKRLPQVQRRYDRDHSSSDAILLFGNALDLGYVKTAAEREVLQEAKQALDNVSAAIFDAQHKLVLARFIVDKYAERK